MPLVVALVGTLGTFVVSNHQAENSRQIRIAEIASAERIAEAQRESGERIASAERASVERVARSELELKSLELFSSLITSDNPGERGTAVQLRGTAVQLLGAVDPKLASRLVQAIAEDTSETAAVREVARSVAEAVRPVRFFPIVASYRELEAARLKAQELERSGHPYPVELYLGRNDWNAVTLGDFLDREEAEAVVKFARSQEIAPDSYLHSSRQWRVNLYE